MNEWRRASQPGRVTSTFPLYAVDCVSIKQFIINFPLCFTATLIKIIHLQAVGLSGTTELGKSLKNGKDLHNHTCDVADLMSDQVKRQTEAETAPEVRWRQVR